ncbi:MAG: cysteine--tRNA ligase [Candidatus Magasanikbacteria bacterium CG10_big_fil_rev_8_21_14_0_10_47_10]|uniref:Cysteine--tRNA ligase n=1 Tax=Candidatus Magasanikbacteria bacterium CG10_big_fil_rev_8_21_14_0_10_47_10 TaxID=1974652 RepID=A0A2H0TSY0_9BACT|nr:MAG: cysteine--tRNA ligase [Candidatus Magasanikbacteria bacterium CG10_big_fil_rev_8_21_14_0_10_47_10]
MPFHIYNTLSRKIEEFSPLHGKDVGMYSCGPTVYDFTHIGNHRTNILSDILKRVLKYNGFKVNHVMNITDVGHLTDDGDSGEDKMEKGAAREGKTAEQVADFYTDAFKADLETLNILEPTTWARATEHIQDQIDQVQQLIDKGYTYETPDGIYMDTTQISDYGALVELNKQDLLPGARVDMADKRNQHDFALWKWSERGERHPESAAAGKGSHHPKRQMEWDAFGRKGFPGWHIECSAMAMKYLGEQFDLHVGGIDLSRVHHVNEIAQAEAVTGKKPWVTYWVHGEFLLMNNEKMAKSIGNLLTISALREKGFDPLAYRYFVLQAHYRKQLNFTIDALTAAQHGLENLRSHVAHLPGNPAADPLVREQFTNAINDDLNMPEALAVLWTALKEDRIDLNMIVEFDKVLGLKLHNPDKAPLIIPQEVQDLLSERTAAREQQDWAKSDQLRDDIAELGFGVEDTGEGQRVVKV